MIGTMGVIQLSVHTIPTQISSILYMIHLGIAIALSIRIGNMIVLSPNDAKKLSYYTVLISSIFFAILSYYVYIYRYIIYSLFTTDQHVINGCEEIWILVTIFTFNMGLFTVVDGIIQGLGKQWIVGHLTVVYLFLLGLPYFCYYGIYKNGGVYVAWEAMLYPNIALTISTILYLCSVDWEQISNDIKNEDDSDSEKYSDDEDSDISDDDDDDLEEYDNDISKFKNDDDDDEEELTGNSHTINGHSSCISSSSSRQRLAQQHAIKTINITTPLNNNIDLHETIPLTTTNSSMDDDNDYSKYYGSTTNGETYGNNNNKQSITNGYSNTNGSNDNVITTTTSSNGKSTTQQQKNFFGIF
jgi:MatE